MLGSQTSGAPLRAQTPQAVTVTGPLPTGTVSQSLARASALLATEGSWLTGLHGPRGKNLSSPSPFIFEKEPQSFFQDS